MIAVETVTCTLCIVCVVKTCECILSTDLMHHVPDIADAGKPAVGMYISMMMLGISNTTM